MLLGLLSSCDDGPRFIFGDCIKGDRLTFLVIDTTYRTDRYSLKVILPKESSLYGHTIDERHRIADRAYKKVKCPDGV